MNGLSHELYSCHDLIEKKRFDLDCSFWQWLHVEEVCNVPWAVKIEIWLQLHDLISKVHFSHVYNAMYMGKGNQRTRTWPKNKAETRVRSINIDAFPRSHTSRVQKNRIYSNTNCTLVTQVSRILAIVMDYGTDFRLERIIGLKISRYNLLTDHIFLQISIQFTRRCSFAVLTIQGKTSRIYTDH